MTREPDLYKRQLYREKIRVDDTKTYQLFVVPIGNSKTAYEIQFCPAAPLIKYHQNSFNSCCLSSLSSAFTVSVTTGL